MADAPAVNVAAGDGGSGDTEVAGTSDATPPQPTLDPAGKDQTANRSHKSWGKSATCLSP